MTCTISTFIYYFNEGAITNTSLSLLTSCLVVILRLEMMRHQQNHKPNYPAFSYYMK